MARAPSRPGVLGSWGLLLVLLIPLALAHADHTRPSLQESEETRTVHATLAGANATIELLRASDPPADYVRHVIDMKRGVVSVEHRPQASQADAAFTVRFVLTRVLEYRDQNHDGAYTPGVDAAIRSWKPSSYVWNASGPSPVRVADVQGQLLRWQGNASGAPGVRLDAVLAGAAFVDEGATVRAQDAALYLDLTDFPLRGTGNLHAIEGVVEAPPGATARLDTGTGANLTAGLVVEAPGRLAFLDWGAEGTVDGKEQRLAVDLDDAKPDGTREFRLHLPLMDESLRLVMVSGVEYAKENRRADAVPVAMVLLVAACVGLAFRRRA